MAGLSLSDLSAPIVTVKVSFTYGRTLEIPVGLLTASEWDEAGLAIPDPAIPKVANRKGALEPNPYDSKYVRQRQQLASRRSIWRVVKALEKGGMAIPGADMDAKVDTVQEIIDTGVLNTLIDFLANAAFKGEIDADSFRAVGAGDGGDADLPAESLDA